MMVNAKTLKLLLADDDEDDRIFFREALDEITYPTELLTVSDGNQLVNYLSSATTLPDFIFLDLNMPGKSGKDCLKEIKASVRLNDIPIIIFSTSSNFRDVEDTYQCGANLYVQKPSGFKRMVDTLDSVLRMDWSVHMLKKNRFDFLYRY